ncbi:DUF397 domain-containing protein [Spirillospora sp. CA-253888]
MSAARLLSVWRKSTHSGGAHEDCVEVAGTWRKSSHSTDGGDCVQVSFAEVVHLRDSKDPHGPMLSLSRGAWASLAASLKRGAHDL